MNSHPLTYPDASPLAYHHGATGGGEPPYGRDPSLPQPASFWPLLRRNILLIVTCVLVAGVAAVLVTARMTPVYEATASLRIDEQPSQISALGSVGLTGSNTVATELEMLRSRNLLETVAESVGYQLRVVAPRGVERTVILAHVSVDRAAEPGPRWLVQTAEGRFALLSATHDTVASAIAPGERVEADGLALVLAPGATAHDLVELDVAPFEVAIYQMEQSLDVWQRNREAGIVDVSVRDADPGLAREVANALVQRFIGSRQGARQLEARETVAFLREQIERVSEQLTSSENELRQFRESRNIVSLPEEASAGVTRRAELLAQRNALEAERLAFSRVLQATRTGGGSAGDSTVARELLAFPTLVQNGMATQLVASLTAAEERRNDLLARRTLQDPEVVHLNARIADLQRQIHSLVTTYLTGLTDQVAAYDSLLRQSDARLSVIPANEIRLAALERNARGAEGTYAMLQGRLKEAEIAAAATDQSVRLVDTAIEPQQPVSPRPLVNLALALVAGGMVGVAGAFLRERADGSLRTRRQLLETTGVPVLGIVPSLRSKGVLAGPLARMGGRMRLARWTGTDVQTTAAGGKGLHGVEAAAYDPDTLAVFAEAHARIVTNVAFIAPEQRPRVLLLTSALPGDGKTTVAGNFALALAQAGRRVLLIDADLRGGRVASMLGMSRRQAGLADVLAGRVDAQQVLARVEVSGTQELHVIVAGDLADATPARLLGSERASALVEWARSEYDTVVIDTPPVTSVADAALLTSVADGVVLVARSGVTAREALEFAVEQLRIVRAPVLGAVLNDVDLRRDVGYDGAYRYQKPYGGAASQRGIA